MRRFHGLSDEYADKIKGELRKKLSFSPIFSLNGYRVLPTYWR